MTRGEREGERIRVRGALIGHPGGGGRGRIGEAREVKKKKKKI